MRNPFRYFNSSAEAIRLSVMMCLRYPLSLRQVEDLLFERGIDVCHETVRFWGNRLARRSQQISGNAEFVRDAIRSDDTCAVILGAGSAKPFDIMASEVILALGNGSDTYSKKIRKQESAENPIRFTGWDAY